MDGCASAPEKERKGGSTAAISRSPFLPILPEWRKNSTRPVSLRALLIQTALISGGIAVMALLTFVG
jgi:hypothetical protein